MLSGESRHKWKKACLVCLSAGQRLVEIGRAEVAFGNGNQEPECVLRTDKQQRGGGQEVHALAVAGGRIVKAEGAENGLEVRDLQFGQYISRSRKNLYVCMHI